MKLYNYIEALTPQQQRKWQEKKGALCYYEWFDRLYDSVDLECAGAIMLAILHYDRTGGAKPIIGAFSAGHTCLCSLFVVSACRSSHRRSFWA